MLRSTFQQNCINVQTKLDIEIIKTSDGSHSLYLKDRDETYHSKHGAIQESRHVFIGAGLRPIIESGLKEINILEVGFGTGLNALLTLIEAEKSKLVIRYTSLEAFPLSIEVINQLNYGTVLEADNEFKKIHESPWKEPQKISSNFTLKKEETRLEDFEPEDQFDLVYFDAFAPTVQPELWTESIFRKMYAALNNGGVLVTYCSKGAVRRAMIAVGFTVERLPGPPGKREILRARKSRTGHELKPVTIDGALNHL
jgi:tRNA U34 5-methylaminomethyl-2-thiouridine-forming methyltransferase MnmC